MNYVREINYIVLVLAVIAFAIATGLAHLLTNALKKIEHMEKAHAEERLQWQAQNADLHDALKDCQEQSKASQRQTIEVEVVKPATKRNSKGQFAKKEASE